MGKGVIQLFVGILIGVFIVAVVAGAYYLGKRVAPPTQESGQASISITPQPTPTPTLPIQKGIIEGSLSYPSEGIPENMMVCVETLQKVKVTCTSTQISDSKYQYGKGYKLKVSPGSYYVYAQLPDGVYKAYYSEFVPCGLSINCPSHEPVEVEVSTGETVTGVDPQDWYNQQ